MKQDMIERLKQAFESGDNERKRELLSMLPGEPVEGLADFLIKALEEESDRAVKTRIMLLFEHQLVSGDVQILESLLRSGDPFVRNSAIELIKRIERNWHPFLRKLAKDLDKDVRKFIIDALANDDSPEARNILREAIDDQDVNIVYTAIEQLGGIRDQESAPRIEQILFESENPMVLCSALEALVKIGICDRKDMIIERFINHSDSLFYFPLIKFISRFGDENHFAFLEKLVEEDWETYSKEIIDALTGIVRNLHLEKLPKTLLDKIEQKVKESDNPPNRYALMQLVSSLDMKDSLAKARLMLEDANPMVKLCGIEIIAEKGGGGDIELLDKLAESSEHNDELLEAIGDAIYKIDKRLCEKK